jgi:hypothetical protein
VFSREDVQRQIAIATVIAVKETAFLLAMDQIVKAGVFSTSTRPVEAWPGPQ